jgi:hypothetical protein
VTWRQSFHPLLKLNVNPVGLGPTGRIRGWSVGQLVVELWHDAISGTFGDEAIVTGDIGPFGEQPVAWACGHRFLPSGST